MTVKAEKEEGPLLHQEASPTAASAHDRKFGPSGVQPHRVLMATAFGQSVIEVNAATGDEAAELALAKHPGAKVAHVGPKGN